MIPKSLWTNLLIEVDRNNGACMLRFLRFVFVSTRCAVSLLCESNDWSVNLRFEGERSAFLDSSLRTTSRRLGRKRGAALVSLVVGVCVWRSVAASGARAFVRRRDEEATI
jgi:hypothetical protein